MSILSNLVSVVTLAVVLGGVRGDLHCDTENSCRSGSYRCDQPLGCLIDCSGEDSCQDSTFTCAYACHVDCSNNQACVDSTFYFESEIATLNCVGQDACTDVTILATNDTLLMMTCDGEQSCEDGIIELFDEATFSLSCDGPDSCGELRCVCDDTECEISGPLVCSDRVDGDGDAADAPKRQGQHSKQHHKKHQIKRKQRKHLFKNNN